MNSLVVGCSRRCSTRPAFSQIAPRYHSTMIAAITTVSGSALPSLRRRSLSGRAGDPSVASVIGMPVAQRAAHAQRDVEESRRLAHIERAAGWQVAVDDL